MTTRRDYYEILEVDRSADEGAIKRAYRKLAMEFHPDRNQHDPQAEEKFKEASEAYEVLSDVSKRQVYDRFGHAGLQGQGFHGFDSMGDVFNSFGDLFEEFFGGAGTRGRRQGPRAYQGNDVQQQVTVSFKEAAFGIDKEVVIHKEAACDACHGKGWIKEGYKNCSLCDGAGQVMHRQGFFMLQTTCSQCRGAGQTLSDPCHDCRGHARVRKKKNLSVKVPAGVEDGMNLLLRGEGDAGLNGGPAGNLYVHVTVERDRFFERKGDNVFCNVSVSMTQAALGAKIKVPTLEGETEIEIPAGIDGGEEVHIKKMGFPNVHSKKRGDQVVRVTVKTPKKISKKQRELLEQFDKS